MTPWTTPPTPAMVVGLRRRRGGEGPIGADVVTCLMPTSFLFIFVPMVQVMTRLGFVDSDGSLVARYPTFLAPYIAGAVEG